MVAIKGVVTVRQAHLRDAPYLPAVERSAGQLFRSTRDLAWIADDVVQSVEEHQALIERGFSWVAVDDADIPVGFMNAERMGNTLHVWEFAVQADHQRRGVGRQLLAHGIAVARQKGLASISLTTFRDIPWNGPFYERCGFRAITCGVPAVLQDILDAEVRRGLPRDRRCVMVLTLRSDPSSR